MAKQSSSNNLATFNKVITSLATDAVAEVEGISLPDKKKSHGSVSVYFLSDDQVSVEFYVDIEQGYTVPVTVAALQESVKTQIERTTKYRVNTVNVHVMNVNMDTQL